VDSGTDVSDAIDGLLGLAIALRSNRRKSEALLIAVKGRLWGILAVTV
jgi:hypothetical protein